MHRYFVTGTDTDVGKTRVCAALALALRRAGRRPTIVKLVQTGLDAEAIGDAQRAGDLADVPHLEFFRYPKPADPWSAAITQGHAELRVGALRKLLDGVGGAIVAEGAGGIMVPLNRTETFVQVAASANLETVVTVGLRLGCINHALLTLRACKCHNVRIAGVVLVERWERTGAGYRNDVGRCLQEEAPILGTIPFDPDERRSVENAARLFEPIATRSFREVVT
jgi:dethiobiotin synthetase